MLDQATRMREMARRVLHAERRARPRLLVVTSGKGGVGKSTISLNTAITLSDAGKRVLLVDADTNLGSLDVMLGLAPRFRMGHVLRGDMALKDVLISPQPGLQLLPASSGDTQHPGFEPGMQERLLEEILRESCDVILLDTGAGLHREVLGYCDRADEILVVSGPEPTSVMDAYAMIKTIWAARSSAVIRLVLNAVHSPREAEETGSKLAMVVKHFLNRELPILGAVPADPAVSRAIAQQRPVVRAYPRSAAGLSLQALAAQMLRHSLEHAERKVIPA